ncbi:MAG: hypothetical protein QOE53_1747 [Pseudonocardiales bacterium]|nr:hypothetical protein [Pseudonocardiales bacterium]
MNDADLKTLINSAVDGELGGPRPAPSWDRAALLDRSRPARRTAAWTVPVLAASAAALLTAGSIVAIDHSRGNRSNQVGNSASPTPSVSISNSVSTDLARAARAYSEAVAGAREATEVAGVSVGPITAKDAARLKDTGLIGGEISSITAPKPGKTYSFTLSYVAGPSENPPSVLTTEVRDVASGSCAQPFLARPGHTYQIRCQATLLAGATGKGALTLRTPTGTMGGSLNLTDPARYPTSAEAARKYSEALASAPEASTVAGVSDRPASAEDRQVGDGIGYLEGPVSDPERGRSYPLTFRYVPRSDGPAVSVLTISLQDVAAGRCPRAFRVRPAHAYLISCQVTFRPGADGWAEYTARGPQDVDSGGYTLSTSSP